MKENSFTLKKKARSRQYPAETITDADCADKLVLHADTATQSRISTVEPRASSRSH